MNPEITALAKQFHFGVLSRGKYMIPDELFNEKFLLQLFRAEAKAREDRVAAERLKQAKFPTYKGFEGWAEIFGDAVLATALLDRLTDAKSSTSPTRATGSLTVSRSSDYHFLWPDIIRRNW